MSKLFKNNGKKFNKIKAMKKTIKGQAKEIERLQSEKRVMRQKMDLVINNMQNI